MGHETRPDGRAHLTFGVQDPKPEPIERPVDLAAFAQQDALARSVLLAVDPPLTGSVPEQVAELASRVQKYRSCLGLLARLAPPHVMERYREVGRAERILGPDWTPEPVSRKTVENVIKAARELDELLDGDQGRWTLGGRPVTDEASVPLLSLHDYLNDVARETGGTL